MPFISRRVLVGFLGGGLAVAPFLRGVLGRATDVVASPPATDDGESLASNGLALGLLAPLVAGSRFARWTIARVSPLERGALTVVVRGDDRREFSLEVLARDDSPLASRAPGRTARFAVFVANGGDGYVPTVEEQGLAAMTLATLISRNECAALSEGFLTHAERIAQHRDGLLSQNV